MVKPKTKVVPLGRMSVRIALLELDLIQKIADRAVEYDCDLDHTEVMMDLTATHCKGCPLQLDAMANEKRVDQFNLMHDIYGIAAHLNRENGELEGCFLPRCAA